MYGYDYDFESFEEKKKKIIKLAIIITASVIVSFFLFSVLICLIAHEPSGLENGVTIRNNFGQSYEEFIKEYYPYLNQ